MLLQQGCQYPVCIYTNNIVAGERASDEVCCCRHVYTTETQTLLATEYYTLFPTPLRNAKGPYKYISAQERRHMQLSASLTSFFFKCESCVTFSSEYIFFFMISQGLPN